LNPGRPDDSASASFVIPAKPSFVIPAEAGIQCLLSELKALIRHSREGGNPVLVNRVHRAAQEILCLYCHIDKMT
jgi:hypothetical protein